MPLIAYQLAERVRRLLEPLDRKTISLPVLIADDARYALEAIMHRSDLTIAEHHELALEALDTALAEGLTR